MEDVTEDLYFNQIETIHAFSHIGFEIMYF